MNEGHISVRDLDGRIVDALARLMHRLEEAHPAAKYSRSDLTRRALVWALEQPAFYVALGLPGLQQHQASHRRRGRVGGANLL